MANNGEFMRNLLQRTAIVISSEDMLPKSPGTLVNDQPVLCAGAALVHEAARDWVTGQELNKLAQDMIVLGKEYIVKKAKEFGLDPLFVTGIILKNDSYDDSERQEQMLEFLSNTASR